MKKMKLTGLFLFIAIAFGNIVSAQTPEGFVPGSITLENGTVLTGFIKESMAKKASVCFLATADAKKKTYEGWDLAAIKTETASYLCIQGDFYSILSSGDVYFLQKNSSATGKITYNGSEPVLRNPVEGKIGSYYLYNAQTHDISLVSKTNYDATVKIHLGSYAPAVQKAEEGKTNIVQLKSAVDLFNHRNTK